MTHDSQLLRMDAGNAGDMTDLLQAPGGGGRGMAPMSNAAQNPVARIKSIMHGRWKYAIPLAIACMAAGAWIGFISKVPRYQSAGDIQFSPIKIDTSGGGTVLMVAFGDYVQTQCMWLHSDRILSQALIDPVWQATKKGNSEGMTAEFSRNLEVTPVGGHVQISFIDEKPEVSLAAVQAVMNAYKKFYVDIDPEQSQKLLNVWETDRSNAQNEISSLATARANLCRDTEFTPDTLEKYYGGKVDELTRTEGQLLTIQLDIATVIGRLQADGVKLPAELVNPNGAAGAASGTQPAADPASVALATQAAATQPQAVATATQPAGPTAGQLNNALLPGQRPAPEELALHDNYMGQLLANRRAIVAQLTALLKSYPKNNPRVVEAQRQLDAINIAIDQYEDEVLYAPKAGSNNSQRTDPRLGELQQLRQSERNLQALVDHTRSAVRDLGQIVARLHDNQDRQDELKHKVAGLEGKITKLQNDYQLSNRAEFVNMGRKVYGAFDNGAYEDKRKSMAVFGGVFGGLLGLGSIFLLGFMDQRVKTIADAKYTFRRSRRVLGILPTLPDNLGDPRQAAFAAHCVHHVRNLLQLSMSPDRGAVLAVTSASPGEGKTSLTLSLGLSFAAANSRTLMIDCDVVGGGLTARVNAIIRRKMGDVLKRQGRITEQQLTLALQLVNQKNMRLGEALVQLGFLTEADIDDALSVQKESLVGLLDVLDGEPLNSCITQAGTPNLFILPRGMAVASNSGQVSAKAIRRIIAEARAQYDVVLIDTGPVLGSLEASIVASESDGVVLAVSRGQQKTLAERAMELLDSIGANTAGIVFNRAQTDDMDTIQYSSSIPANALQSVPQQGGAGGTSRLGPVAYAVASATNQSTAARNASGINGSNAAGAAAGQQEQP